MKWYDNIKEWTGMQYELATRIAMDRDKWRATVSSNVESSEREEDMIGYCN